MNIYLREQLLIHASSSAKKVMKHKGHTLKKNMPRNVSKKNSLRIARYRTKTVEATPKEKFQEKIATTKLENETLQKEVFELKHQIEQYQDHYGLKKPHSLHKTHKAQLQEIISLQREIIANQVEAKKYYALKQISKKEFDTLNEQFEENQNILRKKKQKILTS